MIKKVLIACVVLLLVGAGGLFVYFDSIVKSGIEIAGSQVLGTEITVSSVSLSPLNGSGTISDLKVANTDEWDSPYAFELESVSVNVNASSVFSDVIEIESVTIVQPAITYESRITTDNIRSLLANLSSGESDTTGSPEGEAGKSIIIRELRILDAQLNLVTAIATAPIPLPDIEMEDIGDDGQASSIADAIGAVLSEISSSILSSNLPNLDDLRENAEARLQDGVDQARDQVDDAVEDLGGRLRGLLDNN
ncbi:MAG: hypothetical protein HOF74_11645 [Gammaproteobacteria bacterium]|jgi:hypothetical protein|nr:hypothetical protein [Gammaproteobacteria bacterium]MBT3860479.1 hypothetical protein [Gammaproteobacteria bacterium]MBT3987928.1 hypothetical protein [Gammaproteobacteria bacterium]MBT4256565.1 hypothetical protein [Gammaproteobacteria bacterium]MBT4582455.1 hypothetical protein [Gammaproteobacteria bacterium]